MSRETERQPAGTPPVAADPRTGSGPARSINTRPALNTGGQSALATVSVSVSVTARPLALTLPDARVGTAYSQTFSASNGTAPYTFRASGALPAGLALASDHRLSGTPWSVGTYYFLVNVSDSAGRDITELRTIQSLA